MKNFSNKYMLFYALGLSAVVAILLTVVSVSLKPRQTRNQQAETKMMILKTIGIESTMETADAIYAENIQETTSSKGLPMYTYPSGVIIPLKGNGLWGAIWGYIAVENSGHVVGAIFDHQGETPGLGAEIATDKFASRFVGKEMGEKPIVLKKNADKDNPYEVDAISGSTMTCNGVTEMLAKAFEQYGDDIPKMEDCEAIAKQIMEEEL